MTKLQAWDQILTISLQRGFDYPNLAVAPQAVKLQLLTSQFSSEDGSWRMLAFHPKFAFLLGYKLEELGRWLDDGKDPFEFLILHLNRNDN